jgi:transposase
VIPAVSSIYNWLKQLMVEGVESLKSNWRGGRPSKLTKKQKRQLSEWVKAGPQVLGFPLGVLECSDDSGGAGKGCHFF